MNALKPGARTRTKQDIHTVRHLDRKSTRLNSSHGYNSYAVLCLKKKALGWIHPSWEQFVAITGEQAVAAFAWRLLVEPDELLELTMTDDGSADIVCCRWDC